MSCIAITSYKNFMLIEMKKKGNWKKREREAYQALLEENACYVLITCGKPSEDGKMQVEMTYEGDVSLAAYLIESAQGLLDNYNEI